MLICICVSDITYIVWSVRFCVCLCLFISSDKYS